MPEETFETPQTTESKSINWPKIIVAAVFGLGLLAGSAYAGYYYGTQRVQPVEKPAPAVPQPTLPQAPPSETSPSTKQPEALGQQPFGMARIEENTLKIFSINGTQVKAVSLEGFVAQGYYELEASPNGQKIAFFGLPEGLMGGYDFSGGAAIPLDIFIYDRTLDQFARITNCAESDPDAVGRGKVALCYNDFAWGPDNDTYVYAYVGKSSEDSHLGVGKISTGVRSKIYSSSYMPKISPSGQKLFVGDANERRSFYLIDVHGSLIKKFGIEDFPIPPEVNKEKITHIFPVWGREDSKVFLVIYEGKEHQPFARNYAVLVYAFNPNDENLKLTSITPADQKGSYSSVLGVDSVTGNVVVQHFFGPMEATGKSVSVFSEGGDLVTQDITTPIGSEKAIAYGIHSGFVSVGADNGLWIISIGDEDPVKISDHPYAKGYFIP